MSVVLSSLTAKQIDNYLLQKPHALLLIGSIGSGTTTLLLHIAAKLLAIEDDRVITRPNVLYLSSDKSITIDNIRSIRSFIKLRPNINTTNRLILIDDADKMTIEAQNALLKILEEPPEGTMILISTTSSNLLKPTVISRCFTMRVSVPLKSALENDAKTRGYKKEEIDKAYLMSGGMPGVFYSILAGDISATAESFAVAKDVLLSQKYQRLIIMQSLSTASEVSDLLSALHRIIHLSLRSSADSSQQGRLIKAYRLVQDCEQAIASTSPSIKLLTTHLALGL
jgi:replication-associated recombination protein RarA